MQTTGYIIDKRTNKKILVLVRQSKLYRYFKLRKTGKEGNHFAEDEIVFNQKSGKYIDNLLNGETVIM